VVVQATSLNGRALVEALDAGRFYASSGPVLEAVTATETSRLLQLLMLCEVVCRVKLLLL
jgi:hypothetical protein